jgi:hypothetical protein
VKQTLKTLQGIARTGGVFFCVDIMQQNCKCKRMNNELHEIAESHPNIYRECARRMLPIMFEALTYSHQSHPDKWGVYFALGHPDCVETSMSSVASKIGCSKATISNAATRFCYANNIPPSIYMKREEAQDKSHEARNNTINNKAK